MKVSVFKPVPVELFNASNLPAVFTAEPLVKVTLAVPLDANPGSA